MEINVSIEIGLVSQNVDLKVPEFLVRGVGEDLKNKVVNSFVKSYIENNTKVSWKEC